MSNDLYSIDFTRLLPPPLKNDPNMYALAKVLAEQLQFTAKQIKQNVIYARIDELDEQTLDILAYDLHVDWYDYAYPLAVKRVTIKDSMKVQRKLGTKYAVETAISAIYPNAKVREWWQYDGDPYHFKLTIEIGDELVEIETSRQVLQRIQYYKNLRSVLDGVSYIVKPLPMFNPPPVLLLRQLLLHSRLFNHADSELLFLDGKKALDGTWLLNQAFRGLDFCDFGIHTRVLEEGQLANQATFEAHALTLKNSSSVLRLTQALCCVRFPNYFDPSFVWLNGQKSLNGSWFLNQHFHGVGFYGIAFCTAFQGVEKISLGLETMLRQTFRTNGIVQLNPLLMDSQFKEAVCNRHNALTVGPWRIQTASKLSHCTITQDSMWQLDGKRLCDGRYKLNANIIKETI